MTMLIFMVIPEKAAPASNADKWKTSLAWHQRTTRCIASHPVVIVLCTKLDAACDPQVTVVGRPLTTLDDDQRAVMKLFLFRRLRKSLEGIMLIFGDIQMLYLFDKYSPASGACPLDQELRIQCMHDTRPYALALHLRTQSLYRPTALK